MSLAQFESPRRVLLIKPSALGDVITALPVLRALKAHWPEVHVTWLIRDSFAPLIRHDPHVDALLEYDRKDLGAFWRSRKSLRALKHLRQQLMRGRFDWALDLQGLARSGYFTKWTRAKVRAGFGDARELAWRHYNHRVRPESPHTVDRNLALVSSLGVPIQGARLDLAPEEQAVGRLAGKLQSGGIAPGEYFAVAPTTTWATKQYPLRHWRKVLERLNAGRPVVLLAGPDDVPFCNELSAGLDRCLDLSGQTDIPEFVAAVASGAAALCCDSACKFIAQATGTPCLTLIGPTRREQTGPWPGSEVKSASICAKTDCQGCKKKACRHISCMQLIPPGQVARAAMSLLSSG
jgi:lipopolysaccharide heptosyltransferase I